MKKPRFVNQKKDKDALKQLEGQRKLEDVLKDIANRSVKPESETWNEHQRAMSRLYTEKRELASKL